MLSHTIWRIPILQPLHREVHPMDCSPRSLPMASAAPYTFLFVENCICEG
jgi:hypothetical protein